MGYYSFTDPEGRKAELAWWVDPYRTLYPRSGRMLTIDQA